jgi:hypothetical protein
MKRIILGLILTCIFSSQSFADTFYFYRYREHATDCTALTDGKDKDLCYEIDANTFYKCEPTSGDCDTPSEWKHITGLLPSNPTACSAGQYVTDIAQDGTLTCGTTGIVTSVGLALPTQFTVTSSPVTSSGTLTGSWTNQLQNLIFSSPNGTTGPPTFRSLVSTDIPDLSSVYSSVSHNHSGTYQPLDADLTSVAGLSTSGLVKRTDSNTYSTITDNSSNWNTAYGWGNHASAGYLTSVDSDSNWSTHNSYPSACTAGQYVTAIGDTLTCGAPAGSGDMTKAIYDTDADNIVDVAEAIAASGINWTGTFVPDTSINWNNMVPLNEDDPLWTAWNGSDGINWTSFPNAQGYITGVNWSEIPTIQGTGINWDSISNEELYADGINWTDFYVPDSSINWAIQVPLYETNIYALSIKTGNYTLTDTDSVVLASATLNSITIMLPTAVGRAGKEFTIKKIDTTNNSVVINGDGSEKIDGELIQIILDQYTSITVVSDGSNWYIL